MSSSTNTSLLADVAILGSGFAGSILALVLDKIGLKCVVVDKISHPRFAIGESSTPIGNMILRDLAQKYNLPELAPLATYGTWRDTYPHLVNGRKRGFSYFEHKENHPFASNSNHTSELLVTASTDDYRCDTHWLREDIDHFLAQLAQQANIPVLENTHIQALHHEKQFSLHPSKEYPWRIKGLRNNHNIDIKAHFVVDATGSAGLVPRHLNLPEISGLLKTKSHAIFSHFENVPQWQDVATELGSQTTDYPFHCDDAALHQCIQDGWMWMLRFVNGRVSAGFALSCPHYRINYSVSPENDWKSLLAQYPTLKHLFANATLAEKPGSLYRTGRLQRLWAQAAGPDWALLPHTAGFIDPLHSTGIAHSLSGIEHLAQIIESHWETGDFQRHLTGYSNKVIRELKFIDLLVAGCYPGFGNFPLLTTYSMLYFAAAITYEERRTAAFKSGSYFPHDFLCVDEKPLVNTIKASYSHLRQIVDGKNPSPAEIEQFREAVKSRIEPYNTAGLFSPRINNMYEYTAAVL